jgi:hypothetical protein
MGGCMYLKAVRSDGQGFVAWYPEILPMSEATDVLRKRLDTMLNDPALPAVANATAEEKERLIALCKGKEGWVEEP